MGFDIKYPKISATTTEGKVEQVKSYLYQLVDQLKYALQFFDDGTQVVQQSGKVGRSKLNHVSEKEAQATFNSIKSLIITSADIVNAYYEVINKKLSGSYVAYIDAYSNKDFNELIYKTGYYTGTADPSTASCSNYPINETGLLEVISAMKQNKETLNWWGFAYQTYRSHLGKVYMRSYFSDTGWTAWKQVSFT